MNLSKVLKQKRDEEDRLRNRSPAPTFSETAPGEPSFVDTSKFATKTELAGKADINHTHDYSSVYAAVNHNHDDVYALKEHTHDFIIDGGFAFDDENDVIINLDLGGA